MRHVIFDLETTGFRHEDGHRIVEIGCVELTEGSPSGRTFHAYVDPDRPVDPGAARVHGLTNAFLSRYPRFDDPSVGKAFRAFLQGATVVAHNAPFDVGFANAEFSRLDLEEIALDDVVDTLVMARKKFPGARNDLDALCDRFGVVRTHRTLHGALLDAQLTAQVFIELTGGAQRRFDLALDAVASDGPASGPSRRTRIRRSLLSADERAAHDAFVAELGARALWGG